MVLQQGNQVLWLGEQGMTIVMSARDWARHLEMQKHDVFIITDEGKLRDVSNVQMWQAW